jgi:hypothetical protein
VEGSREEQPGEAPASSRVRRRWGTREREVLEVVEKRRTPPEGEDEGDKDEGRILPPPAAAVVCV